MYHRKHDSHPLQPLRFLQLQYSHNTQLKEDATASFGADHFISKTAATFVDRMDDQMMASMGITPETWQSKPFQEMRRERFNSSERKLLEWAGIDYMAKKM